MYSAVDETRSGPVVDAECLSFATIARRLGHSRVSLLKLDVEGAEYGALRGLLASGLRPSQLLVDVSPSLPGPRQGENGEPVRELRGAAIGSPSSRPRGASSPSCATGRHRPSPGSGLSAEDRGGRRKCALCSLAFPDRPA